MDAPYIQMYTIFLPNDKLNNTNIIKYDKQLCYHGV